MPGTVPLIGEKFPEIIVETTHGIKKLPDDYRGKWLVLFSHPADFTPVCTTEFIAFTKKIDEFRRLNTELLGHSIDSVFSHIKWIEWIKEKLGIQIAFPIIADPNGEVARRLGFLHAQSATHTIRAVIIVDPEGIVRAILYYPQEAGRNISEILRLLRVLQLNTELKRAFPANWPSNELIKDSVIVPPARTVQEASERPSKFKCYDWWFCYEEGKVGKEEINKIKSWFKNLSE